MALTLTPAQLEISELIEQHVLPLGVWYGLSSLVRQSACEIHLVTVQRNIDYVAPQFGYQVIHRGKGKKIIIKSEELP